MIFSIVALDFNFNSKALFCQILYRNIVIMINHCHPLTCDSYFVATIICS